MREVIIARQVVEGGTGLHDRHISPCPNEILPWLIEEYKEDLSGSLANMVGKLAK